MGEWVSGGEWERVSGESELIGREWGSEGERVSGESE